MTTTKFKATHVEERICTITEEKMAAIAQAIGCDLATAVDIIDPKFTYWSERGDCSRDEHFDYLETAQVSEIAAWAGSILRDIRSQEQD